MRWLWHFLDEFRFARRKLGGTWYYVADNEYVSGFVGLAQYWKQEPPGEGEALIKKETYA